MGAFALPLSQPTLEGRSEMIQAQQEGEAKQVPAVVARDQETSQGQRWGAPRVCTLAWDGVMSPASREPWCTAHSLTSCIAVPAGQDLPQRDCSPPDLCPAELLLPHRSIRLPRMLEDRL